MPSGSTGTPAWTNAPGFERDVFTFVRIRYSRGGSGRGGGWMTDLPDSDLNLSFRLQQITSMKVDPDGRILRLTDPELADFPFLYIVEPGGLYLDEAEVAALRKYLLNGGFLWLDDFWGEREWANCEEILGQVFPDRRIVELKPGPPALPMRLSDPGKAPDPQHRFGGSQPLSPGHVGTGRRPGGASPRDLGRP